MLFRGKAITLHGQTWAIANARNPVKPIQISDDFRLGITSLNNAVANPHQSTGTTSEGVPIDIYATA
ncbi:hypothetical protein [Allocoleopsis franciscana]|uniref:hypothetical protein n=1 Tax=Allocoleopsis franciscana TaxID=2886352 RepID=UPI0012DD6F16|nr:hypothetical protein [Allocoleopsis franciscana]